MMSCGGAVVDADVGENSNDICCMCEKEWTDASKGWVLCDRCPNTVCPACTANLGLIVADFFYCPECSGSGQSAAATAGGAVATAVAACCELERLPMSFKAVQKILSNLRKAPDELKYRRLRLDNPKVRQYVDLDPVLRILQSIGFVRKNEEAPSSNNLEQVLVLEGSVDVGQITELIDILDSLQSEDQQDAKDKKNEKKLGKTVDQAPDSDSSGAQKKKDDTSGSEDSKVPVEPEAKKRKKE